MRDTDELGGLSANEKICCCVFIRPFLTVKMKSLVVSSAGLYCRGCTGEGES